MMQGPPPPMMQQSMMSRNRMLIVGAIGLGLLLLMAGGIIFNLGGAQVVNDTNEQQINRYNQQHVWAPILWDVGMFFFVGGLVLAGIVLEELDPFVRLFLLILAFIALLLVLSSPTTIFG